MTKPQFPLFIAEQAARRLVSMLAPACDRTAIAGSIRRERHGVGDIEIVVIPKIICAEAGSGQLFATQETESYLDRHLGRLLQRDDLDRHPRINGRNAPWGARFRKLLFEGRFPVDLFIVTAATWGVQITLRTGPADFGRLLVTNRCRDGLLPDDLSIRDGRVWRRPEPTAIERLRMQAEAPAVTESAVALDTPEERDVFEAIGLDWIEPRNRTESLANRIAMRRPAAAY